MKRAGRIRPYVRVTPDEAERRFRRLYDSHEPAVRGYALRRVDVAADAADVVAETFVVAWRRLGEVPPDAERAWLLAVARRVLSTVRRGHTRRHRLSARLREEFARRAPDPDPPTGSRAEAVLVALAALPSRDREVLTLSAWDGLSPAEIALVLGIPDATVRTRLHRARARLRRGVEANAGGPAGHSSGDGRSLVTGTATMRTEA